MKQLTTKSIESLLTATAMNIGGIGKRAKDKQLERILQRHDRKGELRASILGITAVEYRSLQKRLTFDRIVRKYGFMNRDAFSLALAGKLRGELLQRGWSRHRIETFVDHKLAAAA